MRYWKRIATLLCIAGTSLVCYGAGAQVKVTPRWDRVTFTSRTTPTLQVVVNPMLEKGSPIHDGTFSALKQLGAEYVRYVPWHPYPHMAVAELKPPTATETFWDFTHIDPIMKDFMDATRGHSVIINFSTIPAWMFKAKAPEVPSDPEQVFWGYNVGTQLRDTTCREVADYFARVFSWYTRGGFTDELGKFHRSGLHYKIPYWEVLNEMEHRLTPPVYTKIYDAVVTSLKQISPSTRFVGLALNTGQSSDPDWFQYFLDPANHAPGVPIDGISYHFYARPDDASLPIDSWQYTFFDKVDGFMDKIRYIENIRERLAPHTFTTVDEIGNILTNHDHKEPIPDAYWNLSGAMFAYIFMDFSRLGIEAAGESQLVGYPTQFPDVSMMNWTNAKPNARFWVLSLLKNHFSPGDKLVSTSCSSRDVAAQGYLTGEGKELLVINKRKQDVSVTLPDDMTGARVRYVDGTTGDNPPGETTLRGTTLSLRPFSVAVVMKKK